MKRISSPIKASILLPVLVVFLALNARCNRGEQVEPPVAQVVPVTLEKHGHVRTDNYYWLRERENPDVRKHLEAENRYTAAVMAHTETLQNKLFEEFKGRIRQTDMSVPYKKDGYFYYTRMEEGKEYPIYCRKKALDAQEQLILNVNRVAAGHKFCRVRAPEVSPNGTLLAYGVDTAGRRFHTIHFQNLETGEHLPDLIPDTTESMVWANDNKTFFYIKQHPTTLRHYRLYRHVLGTDPAEDELVYEEKDETYDCLIFKTKSKKYMMLVASHIASTEFRYLEADDPRGTWKLFLPRQPEHEYYVDHYQDHFYVLTNREAKNFRLMKTPVAQTAVENWTEVLPHRKDVLLEGFEIFRDHLMALERKNGLLQLHIRPWSGQGEHSVDFGEAAYTVYPTDNYEFDTAVARYEYTSMTTPRSIYDYDMTTREKKLLKREEVLGGFDPANYLTERLYAPATDGARIPVSLVHHKNLRKDGTNPLFLEGYGAYGSSSDVGFDPFVISLLDRGFVCAIAHIRGGAELGRDWYNQGRLLNKMNTFTDFIACGEHLVRQKYADPQREFAEGASAGGLLIGAVINLRPDLFRGVIAKVPWVDALTSSLDESIPLTTTEYDEWGNPNERQFYDYILTYSPYDNVRARNYSNVLALTSFEDSQVQYWEPAKWVAKLRAKKTGRNLVLLKTEFEASHGGVSGRYKQYRQRAFEYAFMLDLAGIRQ